MNISDQVKGLRKLCVHSEFLCLITPRIYGGGDDETDFALSLIKSALQRPPAYSVPIIEIHTQSPAEPRAANSLKNNICAAIRSVLEPGQTVTLVLWPRLLDRHLIAGVYTEMSDGKRVRSPRWGISMQHIARKIDSRESKPPTSWSLVTKDELGDKFELYCAEGSIQPSQRTVVTG